MMRYECAWAETENSADGDIDSRFWHLSAKLSGFPGRSEWRLSVEEETSRTDIPLAC